MNLKNLTEKIDILRFSGLAFLIFCIWSAPLWFSTQPEIPRCPIIGSANYAENLGWLDMIWSGITLSLLFFGLWFHNRKWIIIGIVLLLISFLIDLNRLTAVSYFFICLWILWLLNSQNKSTFTHTLILLLAGVYFWSGFHKWNIHFYTESYQWLMDTMPITKGLYSVKWFSYILPALESIPAICIVFPKTRRLGIYWLIAMHIYIISFMLYSNWGEAIVIWNLFMIMCLLYCLNFTENLSMYIKKLNRYSISFISLISVFIPFLFCFDLISSEFGYSMYCGRYTVGNIAFTPTDMNKLDKKYQSYLIPFQGFYLIDIDCFGFKAYDAELCRSEYTYKKMFQKISEPYSDSCMLILVRRPMLGKEEYEYVYKE